ncbi:pyridoxal-5'-phosphate-dependent protein subunit beta [Achromobacter marplatensis]|uniref:Threonine synthase n=1 Tax=Achromobacter marplatensis TaxID=470868 RepID=A0ABX9G8Y2_9BURK|nr:pyridoxal-phosphate dependent enzyme [Achromobacter marplatensis]OWT67165.1 pyridoxal-5'-phosphate-dependent protein subunit beta [Achromobacter marplatensis]RBP19267.1 threonine synthase [Achromobacter marplatensis]CAB3654405.1 Threonine synthase [Achromobacter marplatensis]
MSQPCYVDPLSGERYPITDARWCSDAQTPLMISPLPGISRDDIDTRDRSIWRYRAALPQDIAQPVSLGEGATPMVERAWGGLRPHFKLEWFNPTCSFKDRGAAVMLSWLRQIGIPAVAEDSSGNGGAAIAAFGAAADMGVTIFAPAYTSIAKVAQIRAFGADVRLVEGPRENSQTEAIRASRDIFYASHNWQPFFLQGTKAIAYEMWEDFGFQAPDNVVIPAGAGSNVLGCAIGFAELLAAGQIRRRPKLFVAQPLNCSPVDASFHAGVDSAVPREALPTVAEGTAIKHPVRLREVLQAVRASGGQTVAVPEADIVAAVKRLALSGLYAEPTSATAAAALQVLEARGAIQANERTVVLLTGTGIKSTQFMTDLYSAA